jgi:hypothetical protein
MNFDDDEIVLLLRLKRDEQPPSDYFENFLSEFRRRQRDELLRQPVWRICFERAQGFALRHNVRSLAPYPATIAAVLVCGGVVSIRIYQQPEPTQVTLQSSPLVPTRSPITDRELDFAPPEFVQAFDAQPAVLRPNSRDIRRLSADRLRSDEFVPLKLEWESLDDQPLLEK